MRRYEIICALCSGRRHFNCFQLDDHAALNYEIEREFRRAMALVLNAKWHLADESNSAAANSISMAS